MRCLRQTLNPTDLLDLKCRVCGATPEIRRSEHHFLKLSAFQDRLIEWVETQDHWRPNVQNFTLQMLKDGLKDRAITGTLTGVSRFPCRVSTTREYTSGSKR